MSARFDRRFAGPNNAGLRKKIRETADGVMPCCAAVMGRAVLSLAGTVALTAAGRATLATVASDYREARSDYEPRCDCSECTGRGFAYLGAKG